MTKWIILFLVVFGIGLFSPGLAHARSSHRRPSFHFRFPLPLRYSKPAEPAPTYSRPIYQHKESPMPRVYTLDKPLVDDPIYRPLIFSKSTSAPSKFYRYDKERRQYTAPNQLHSDGKIARLPKLLSVEIEGQIYYYDDGFFYKVEGNHLIVVPPVVNSVVQKLPIERKIMGGHFEYNGIYFQKIPEGYRVINLPIV